MHIFSKCLVILGMIATLVGCSSHDTTIFIVDTSGSMKQRGLIDDVKKSMKQILFDYKKGQTFYLITFDYREKPVIGKVINEKRDLLDFTNAIDDINANGEWTNLGSALEYTLNKARDIIVAQDGKGKVNIVLYTDGINDPPPQLHLPRELDFNSLFSKYFSKSQQYPWYIYYVELGDIEPGLAAAIGTTAQGRIITAGQFQSGINFMSENIWRTVVSSLLVALAAIVVLFVGYMVRTRFRKGVLIPDAARRTAVIELPKVKRHLLARRLKIGTRGDIVIAGVGVGEKHAVIGVNWLGRTYVKALDGDKVLRVNGHEVNGSQIIRDGAHVEFGGVRFTYRDRAA